MSTSSKGSPSSKKLLTRDECVNVHADCGGVEVNIFKQALHLSVATAEDHDVVGRGEVGHVDFGSNLNPWVKNC